MREYALARAALTDPRLTRATYLNKPHDPLARHVLNFEGERHQRARAALAEALTARLPAVASLIQPVARQLLAGLSGESDVAARFVRPLVLALMDELLGLSGGDQHALRWWHQTVHTLDAAKTAQPTAEIRGRLARLIDARRGLDDGLIGVLARDNRVAAEDLPGTIFFTLSAGYVNTVNFLGLALLALAQEPEQHDWLRSHVGAVPAAVEELLRFCEPPQRASARVAAVDADVAGQPVSAGTAVYVYRGSASRDPARFADPHRLDLRRPGRAAGSLAFGVGRHYCLGAELVRTIADVTLLSMLPRVTTLGVCARTKKDWDFGDELWLDVAPATTSFTVDPATQPGRPS